MTRLRHRRSQVDAAATRTDWTPNLDERAERFSYFAEGYRLGYAAGHFVGYGQGETAEAELWADALGIARLASTQASYAELQRRRAHTTTPCDQSCGRCSRCIHAAAYRRHRGDYRGRQSQADAA